MLIDDGQDLGVAEHVVAALGGLLLFVSTGSMLLAQAPASGSEDEYIAVLQSAASPAADKAMACKKLAVVGSDAAVPELAKLLGDEHLASWARIPLEAIPGATASEALRTAAGSLDGLLLVGVVNSMATSMPLRRPGVRALPPAFS